MAGAFVLVAAAAAAVVVYRRRARGVGEEVPAEAYTALSS
jgi:hypothetical protein